MSWRNLENFPNAEGDILELRARTANNNTIFKGEKSVNKVINKWQPMSTILVASIGSDRYLPVLNVNGIREKAHQSYLARLRLMLGLLFLNCLFILPFLFIIPAARATYLTKLEITVFSIFIWLLLDYLIVARNISAITDRALFAIHVSKTWLKDAFFWISIMVLIAAFQCLFYFKLGDVEELVMQYGTLYSAIDDGQFWRFLVGPFFHISALHWLSNLINLIIIGVITGAQSRLSGFLVFIVGTVIGAIAGFFYSPISGYDSYLGVSGGVFAMFGWCTGNALIKKDDFPINLSFTLFTYGLLNIVVSYIFFQGSSVIAHSTTYVFGIFYAYLSFTYRNKVRHL